MKPENIIFDKNMKLKITDFGTAKVLDKDSEDDDDFGKTKGKETFCGTAQYVSPEILNDEKCSPGSDLWALGCIIYQMLTGDHPFKGASNYLIFQQILKRNLTFPDNFPEDAKDLVDKLLQIKQNDRLGVGKSSFNCLNLFWFVWPSFVLESCAKFTLVINTMEKSNSPIFFII